MISRFTNKGGILMKKKTKKRLMRFMEQNNLVIMVIAIDSPMLDLPPSDMKAKDFVKNEKYFKIYRYRRNNSPILYSM